MKKIFTPLGVGRIIYKFQNGTYAVELEHGGGHIFHGEELWPRSSPHHRPPTYNKAEKCAASRRGGFSATGLTPK